MNAQRNGTLYVDADEEKIAAEKSLAGTGLQLQIVKAPASYRDFDTPLLICYWGVFEGLPEIDRFRNLVMHQSKQISASL